MIETTHIIVPSSGLEKGEFGVTWGENDEKSNGYGLEIGCGEFPRNKGMIIVIGRMFVEIRRHGQSFRLRLQARENLMRCGA